MFIYYTLNLQLSFFIQTANSYPTEIYLVFFLAYPSVQLQEKRIVQGVPLNVKVESLNMDTAIMV